MRVSINTPLMQLLLAVSLIAIIYWLNESSDQPAKATSIDSTNKNQPSAFIKNAAITQFDEQGYPEIKIESAASYYYKLDSNVHINKPTITLWDETNRDQLYHLSAEQGIYDEDKQTLALTGSVRVDQTNQHDTKWTIETSELHYDRSSGFISTKQQVTIKQNQQTLEAIGMNAWVNERKITLLSKVRGRYENL